METRLFREWGDSLLSSASPSLDMQILARSRAVSSVSGLFFVESTETASQ